jgi:dihydroxyacetone kinase-like protein
MTATPLRPDLVDRLIERVAACVIEHAEELTRLDQAIGDGDHGINLRRGVEAVLADRAGLAAKTAAEAVKGAGMHLVMKVGGASGPLYGTLLMTLAKGCDGALDHARLAEAFAAAIAAVQARGKSERGQKTMLDVLIPVHEALRDGKEPGEIRGVAAAAAVATVPMRAVRGRASFLGERSIGHMDPGARSSELMIGAVCDVLEEAEHEQ